MSLRNDKNRSILSKNRINEFGEDNESVKETIEYLMSCFYKEATEMYARSELMSSVKQVLEVSDHKL